MSEPKKTSFVVLGFKEGKETVLFENAVLEVAIKFAENLLFTQDYDRLRIAQMIINMSVEPKDGGEPLTKAVA